jgi:hypothetical protein
VRGAPYHSLGCRGSRIPETNYSLLVWATIRGFVVPLAKDQLHCSRSSKLSLKFGPKNSMASQPFTSPVHTSQSTNNPNCTGLRPARTGTKVGNIDQLTLQLSGCKSSLDLHLRCITSVEVDPLFALLDLPAKSWSF